MDFGLFFLMQRDERWSERAVYDSAVEQMLAAEALGYHSVWIAEHLAVLDVVSGGRLDVGIGRGGTLQDYQTFRSERADARMRVEEGIALIQQCWSGAPFDFKGQFHSAERLHVRPRPSQRPHPPLFIATNSEDSVL